MFDGHMAVSRGGMFLRTCEVARGSVDLSLAEDHINVQLVYQSG